MMAAEFTPGPLTGESCLHCGRSDTWQEMARAAEARAASLERHIARLEDEVQAQHLRAVEAERSAIEGGS